MTGDRAPDPLPGRMGLGFPTGMGEKLRRFLDRHLGIIFLLPGIALILLMLTYPVISNFYFSFTNKHLVYQDTSLVGFENYIYTFEDSKFYSALYNTIIWTSASITLQLVLGFGVALLLNLPLKGRIFFRLAMIVPYAFPPVTVALIWKWMLHSLFGVFNYLLVGLGLIEAPISWLSHGATAMSTVVMINVWFGFPLFALAILAGLQSIPEEHFEVARLEGASFPQTIRYVIIPAIIRIVGIIVVLRTIWVFNTFDLLFLTTGGGPVGATETLPLYAYHIGWHQGFIGQTAAIAIALLVILSALIWVYFRLFRIEEDQ